MFNWYVFGGEIVESGCSKRKGNDQLTLTNSRIYLDGMESQVFLSGFSGIIDIMGDLPYTKMYQVSPLEFSIKSNFEEVHLW